VYLCPVLPEYEWSGIETEALAWAQTRLAQLRQWDADRWSGTLVSGARRDDAQRMVFLEQQGFRRGAYAEVNLLRLPAVSGLLLSSRDGRFSRPGQ
jgi:hypothetical protein